jgi:hypothetical protein
MRTKHVDGIWYIASIYANLGFVVARLKWEQQWVLLYSQGYLILRNRLWSQRETFQDFWSHFTSYWFCSVSILWAHSLAVWSKDWWFEVISAILCIQRAHWSIHISFGRILATIFGCDTGPRSNRPRKRPVPIACLSLRCLFRMHPIFRVEVT